MIMQDCASKLQSRWINLTTKPRYQVYFRVEDIRHSPYSFLNANIPTHQERCVQVKIELNYSVKSSR